MYDQYLIPANTKRGKLILGWFRPFDLILFGTGIWMTMIFLAFIPMDNVMVTIIVLAPAVITGFLVVPVPYYHNILNIVVEMYQFYTGRRQYLWKGWCYKSGSVKKRGK